MKQQRANISVYQLVTTVVLAGTVLLFGCGSSITETTDEYITEIEQWQQLRIDSLKGHTGFLNLAGLFWISGEVSSIGSDSVNTFIFPAKAVAQLGAILIMNDSLWFVQDESRQVTINGDSEADTTLIFVEGEINLTMTSGDLHWFIIKRGTTYGIRLKDYKHPLLTSFNNIDNFPIDAKWRVSATWELYKEPKVVTVHNQVGMDLELNAPGALHFELEGKPYALEPIGSVNDKSYFVMIFDKTSGHGTYGSGRYINVVPPDENGKTYIDFNKAYNPPCAYTEFATCLFPHKANRLPLRVEAGEQYSGSH